MIEMSASNVSLTFGEPDYMSLYKFELNLLDYTDWQSWFEKNWNLSIYFAVTYVILIFAGKQWMKNRPPYHLKGPLLLWNLGLALFSILGFVRTLPEILHLINQPNGFHLSVCDRSKMHIGTIFWCLMIGLSKVVELGDTAFIVLRKQPLIFLHWYHHATVMLYCWYTYWYHDAAHRWFMTINFFVHSVMYSYFAIKAMGIHVPKSFAMVITFTQLLQMFFGSAVNIYALWAKTGVKSGCQTETFNLILALMMYASYAVLFANFFRKSYLDKSKKEKKA